METGADICRACGACCATSRHWPRFTLEDDATLALIPEALVDPGLGRMRTVGHRCAALAGEIGQTTGCTIYDARPIVCRDCLPGDEACAIARRKWGLPALTERPIEG